MDEKKEVQEEGKKEAKKPEGEGDKPKSPQLIVDANAAAERMEQANKKTEELIARQEALAAERALGGEANAGAQEQKKEKETDLEYSKQVERGEANPLKEDGFI